MSGGEVITKPIVFKGNALHLNFASSSAGQVRVEIQSADGKPIKGFSLDECHDVFGDTTDRAVSWKGDADLGALAGQAIRLRFSLNDAHLYAYQFQG